MRLRAGSRGWRGRAGGAASAAALVALGAVAAACGGSSQALGVTACRDVRESIATYESSLRDHGGAQRAAAQALALRQLRSALGPAAQAASGDGTYQALMTTISESPAVPEAYLVPALQAQCAADAGVSGSSGGGSSGSSGGSGSSSAGN